MSPDELRAIRNLLALARNDIVFDLELVTAFSVLRETYGLAKVLLMVEEETTHRVLSPVPTKVK